MTTLRPVRAEDLEQIYAISLLTGDAGGDASQLHHDGKLIGHIYSAPYIELSPETAFVAEDFEGVAGYIVGVFDTVFFEERLERDWWPALRETYADPQGDPASWDADQKHIAAIHRPSRVPATLVEAFPAHIHMNLLPRLQGQGMGTKLFDRWLTNARQAAVEAVHLGANANNHGALRFWGSRGFSRIEPPLVDPSDPTAWFGQRL
ncbi:MULTISPECIES: GNAT family N-acetyltransferase [Rhizobium]|uniref:Acetyltransferase protein n=1 Tax=Rhizobium favelukesii TaxID=348824 RepID=W6RAI4_9HYPH|nr:MULTISPECIES: GNAT family N-acetyltransferase [Rhizobium]MCA0801566.1 GNAT family N-acetyltransferase [Rhizobium sp. T1473]MCS0459336.1 GNAT family N-acetyltransferase [Rhizobium favelukesii]UFS81037.1 GNAT family N-acetyltransferase [Rhizobium sp. T136]CDM57365.1 acetyltransferase protein [Rhizobium favelukesii]